MFNQALEDHLKNEHLEEMKQQLSAHKVTIETVKDQANRARQADLREQAEKLRHEQGEWKLSKEWKSNNKVMCGILFFMVNTICCLMHVSIS